ncbi:MAG: transposase [Holophagales bacterium]|nr:transposase [Holophagales bacterium]
MAREPRIIPPNSLQHVTDVTFQNRFLLRPSAEVNEILIGVLGRAQKRYEMTICGVAVLSSHYHLLVRPKDGQHLSQFMWFFKTNLSKEVGGRLLGRRGSLFDGRFHATTVTDEEAAQVKILQYLLSQGVKEMLVDRVLDWPGVHCAAHLIDGTPLEGRWFDRTAERRARSRQGREVSDASSHSSIERVKLSPLPCWEHLPEAKWRQAVAEMVEEIDRRARAERAASGQRTLGVAAVLAANPFHMPDRVVRKPKPRFHAASKAAARAMVEAWSQVLAAYRRASEELRAGNRNAKFPEGTFPPASPFVPFSPFSPFSPFTSESTWAGAARGQPA